MLSRKWRRGADEPQVQREVREVPVTVVAGVRPDKEQRTERFPDGERADAGGVQAVALWTAMDERHGPKLSRNGTEILRIVILVLKTGQEQWSLASD